MALGIPRVLLVFFAALLLNACAAEKEYSYLALEGGGVKGIAYAGAIRALEDAGILRSIKGVAGSSAGAIAATLIGMGMTGSEIETELKNQDFQSLLHGGQKLLFGLPGVTPQVKIPNIFKGMHRLQKVYGWYSGRKIEEAAEEVLTRKTGIENVTFAQLYERTGVLLRITGTCVNSGKLVYFDKRATPNMRVSKAVHISSAIPFFFEPVKHEGRLYIDGGALRNLPLDSFEEEDPGAKTLALSLRRSFDLSAGNVDKENFSSFLDYSGTLFGMLLWGPESANSLLEGIQAKYVDVVRVNSHGLRATDFHLNFSTKVKLVRSGWDAVTSHLDTGTEVPSWLTRLENESKAWTAKELSKKRKKKVSLQAAKKLIHRGKENFDSFTAAVVDFVNEYIDAHPHLFGNLGCRIHMTCQNDNSKGTSFQIATMVDHKETIDVTPWVVTLICFVLTRRIYNVPRLRQAGSCS